MLCRGRVIVTKPLKEVDAAASAVAETPEQVVALLRYAIDGALPGYTEQMRAAE